MFQPLKTNHSEMLTNHSELFPEQYNIIPEQYIILRSIMMIHVPTNQKRRYFLPKHLSNL